jgi:hypothetical protein
MKKINLTLLVISLILGYSINGQNLVSKANDLGRIALVSFVPEQIEQMPDAARSMLTNKLSQIATQSGMGGSSLNQRFIITANIIVLTKDLTPTAPPMTAMTLEVALYIGDGIDGTIFASQSVTLKGVGENETKAYMAALRNLKTNDPQYQTFLEKGKTKIIEYYNSKCDFIIKEAQALASQSQFDAAIYKLTGVPEVCKDCFNKCMDAIAPIYQKRIDKDCLVRLAAANNIWSANQDANSANSAGEVLAYIDPQAACYKEAKALTEKMAKRVKELDQREWNFKLKQQQDDVDITKATINAVRDIGVAYGNGQPKSIVYNTRGWW